MARIRLVLVGLLAFTPAACGGGDDGGDPDGGVVFDAGPPDAPVATGYTARGGYAGALALARDEHDDATLFEVTSAEITPDGEVDPELLQSFWAYSFASISTGVRVNVTYLQDQYFTSLGTVNPEGLKTMPADWMDSDEAVAAIAAVGYQAPGPSETYTKVSMKVNMETLLDQCTDPVWEIEKITAEPGEDVVSERWFALFCTSADTKLGCNPAGECSAVP